MKWLLFFRNPFTGEGDAAANFQREVKETHEGSRDFSWELTT